MKSKLIILFLFTTFISKAQFKGIVAQIKETNNKNLIEYVEIQEKVFKELEVYLAEISQQEFNLKNDSINSIKFIKLLGFYDVINKNVSKVYKIPIDNSQYLLSEEYIKIRLTKIDSLYALFMSKRVAEKAEKKDNEKINVTEKKDSNQEEKKPIHESCLGLTNENMCTADFIRKKIARNYYTPDLRDFSGKRLKMFVAFVINKNGEIVFPTNSVSSGYFEFDMEVIRVISNSFSKDKFIPAQQNGESINSMFTFPIYIDIP